MEDEIQLKTNRQLAVDTFKEIKNKGWHKDIKPNNKDGGHGNTLEHCFGVRENNLKEPDWYNFEIKSVPKDTKSMISLFSSIPDYPNESGQFLIDKYGEVDSDELRRFYTTLRGTEEETKRYGKVWTRAYKKHDLKIRISMENRRMNFIERQINGSETIEAYWKFDSIKEKSLKMTDIIFGNLSEVREIDGKSEFYWDSIDVFWGLDFDNFINEILHANIQFDFRFGVYKSPPKKRGKAHDRGSAFRLKAKNWVETCKRVWQFHEHIE